MNWLKKHASSIFLVLALIFGLGLLAYPSFANYWNSFTQSRAIVSYAETVATMDTDIYDEILNNALDYNAALARTGINWIPTDEEIEAYNSQLNINGTGNMGYIEIPKIGVSLPLYHGTDEAVLQTSIGHITGTSLPVGGESSHCVLSGHRGLPSARLFSDLDKLIEGDKFILTILDQTLTYQVDQIRIVEPSDLSEIYIAPGQDYCTLVTCTPYGINTHRMLVRGHRVENDKVVEIRIIADALIIDPVYVAPVIALPVLLLLIIWVVAFAGNKKSKARGKEDKKDKKGKKGKKGKNGAKKPAAKKRTEKKPSEKKPAAKKPARKAEASRPAPQDGHPKPKKKKKQRSALYTALFKTENDKKRAKPKRPRPAREEIYEEPAVLPRRREDRPASRSDRLI